VVRLTIVLKRAINAFLAFREGRMGFFNKELAVMKESGLYRALRLIESGQSGRVHMEGREVLLLCSNNYLGLAEHPVLKEASIRAVNAYGSGSGASRLVSGNMSLHEELERKLAAFKCCEGAVLFNCGYSANVGLLTAVAGHGDTIYSDRLNHASIVDGALLSRAKLVRYPHNDVITLEKQLESHQGKGRHIIVTDGVFSMDGDIAPLRQIVELKKKFKALLMVDDAHGTGVLGAGGRGSAEACGVQAQVDIHMGTLGKGLGSFGAYATGSAEMVDFMRNRARSFIFSTSLPPAVLAASIAALEIVASPEGRELRNKLDSNRSLFSGLLNRAGFNTLSSATQIIPLLVGDAATTMEFSRRLLARGVFVQGIRPPTVPAGSSRLRCTVMANHSVEDLEQASSAIVSIGRDLGIV
jgi:glycine C-acetyltransferase